MRTQLHSHLAKNIVFITGSLQSLEEKQFPIEPSEFRLWLHLLKARLYLEMGNLKAIKREVKDALNGTSLPPPPGTTNQVRIT